MKIKTKLNAGVGLLFLMIILLSVLGGWYINKLKKDTNNILVANYNTLEYSRSMLLSLEDVPSQANSFLAFEKHLLNQQKNITEPGEKEITDSISAHFNNLKANPTDHLLQSKIRKDITELMELNMNAIEHKSKVANATADNAIVVISAAGMLCFLIAFILLVNLPSNIADPIKILTDSIRQIANQNYKERVHFESHSEFGDLAQSFNVMAEKLQEYSESKLDKILQGKKRIETLIDKMNNPVVGIDEENRVLFVNDEAIKIIGIKKEILIGKLIQDIAVTNDLVREIIRDMIQPELKKEHSEPMKIYSDGKESYFEKEIVDINIIPTGERNPQFIGKVIILKNITPFKELDIAKTNFMGTVSHEFKTPISSIKMGLHLLENPQIGTLNDEQKHLIEGIREDANRLLNITGELLNMTQLESGIMQLQIKPADVDAIIHNAIDANKSAAEQKQITIKVNKDIAVDKVLADSEKTTWVLNNLLSNAIRYSYENAAVHISVEQAEQGIKFSVQDFGKGIEEQYHEKIFERYFRIPGSKKEGTGLGLSIGKELIEAQGGLLTIESELGKGSTFSFVLKKA
ncbi:PAS domain-containing sensor histidine kinase [Cloacibacterium rupense]|uniref:histidine kinase n=1 Tax=Cloacibacterium rupense TaxID=517423 RepID=A0ABQ2NGQ5_9FLAO|nr:sensor histidine kinase [Cloacibacterium rupense]GGP02074.1 PAS domain-containing sensor histidine kinase [Cloacibacterium rupense]